MKVLIGISSADLHAGWFHMFAEALAKVEGLAATGVHI
jgi:hypothetical protein